MTADALSIVGRGLVAWLHDHGPATLDLMVFHFTEADDIGPTRMAQAITAELRHLESLGAVRRVPYTNGAARSVMWATPNHQGIKPCDDCESTGENCRAHGGGTWADKQNATKRGYGL